MLEMAKAWVLFKKKFGRPSTANVAPKGATAETDGVMDRGNSTELQ
jgi:hypothetical protein